MQRPLPRLRRIALPAVLVCLAFWPQIVFAQPVDPDATRATGLPGGLDNIMIALLITLAGGCLGGIVYELLSLQGNVELPHRYLAGETPPDSEFRVAAYAIPQNLYDLGMAARIFIGGMSALAALLLVTPVDIFKLLATSLVAGSAGASIFDMLRARLTATVAQADATIARANLGQLEAKVEQITQTFTQLSSELQKNAALQPGSAQPRAAQPNGDTTPESSPVLVLPTDTIQEIDRLLGEAKGLAASAHPRRQAAPDRRMPVS